MAGRSYRFERIFNVRDVGGLPTADGGLVREGLLFRGAGLHRLDETDVEGMADLGLHTVFDLRTPGELRRFGEFPSHHVEVVHFHAPMMQRTWRGEDEAGMGAAEMLGLRYAAMLETGRDAVGMVVDKLAEPDALPAAFFCAAGKDRTGVMAAILLGLVGVPDEEIAADYALSEANMPPMVAWLDANEPATSEWIRSLPPALLEAPADAMLALLRHLRETHGSVESYVLWCGARPASVSAVRAALVAPR